ncbi:MAG: CotH kinase family protein [Prevotella sp.]|nr:CotH kinase family protein [Prevotella sp.]
MSIIKNVLAVVLLAVAMPGHAQLVINEIMQSNIECTMDDIHEFPDSWVELYNPTDEAISLKDYQISNKNKVKKAWQLPDKTVAAKGYVLVYCDKEGLENNRLHADFRLESAKGCTVYLFKDKNAEPVDSLPYVDNKPMVKMPAPDVAFGRKTDGADEWGYQLTPTPGKANTGQTCNAKQILGAPVFSESGRVVNYGQKSISVELSLPEDAPKEAYITYTTDGSEPTATGKKYTEAFHITKSTAIRAKVFCEGWLSPLSTAQSYIFHARRMTVPIFSIQTDDRYLNDKEIGLFANNNSKEDKKLHDWRRPVNVEFFPEEGAPSAINQPGETRIQGGQSRANALKSMVFYANKRFDPDHKRYSYEFFPDQKPGVTEFKSFSLRDGGNDFGDLYFRDLIIQRTMGPNVDLDWQAGHTAVLYINGEYMGMLNIRERSNEDNIYSNYDGLEDVDEIEIAHEKENNQDLFIEELKEGDDVFYQAFKEFYSQKGHTLAEYEEWMDVSEFLNIMVMNLFYGNIDFPGNNIVFWRPNDDAKVDLPKRWRFIVKDTDFGLGLYSRKSDYNTIDLLYNPSKHPDDNWAFTEPATRLIKNMLEDPDILKMFIDKCCVYMGDFMNATGTGATIDAIKDEALDEFVAHRVKYPNQWGGNSRQDLLNKFNDAKKWLAGYTEQGWWGPSTTYLPRTDYFLQHMSSQWKLGTAVVLTINKTEQDVAITVNGIKLSGKTFDGKFFPNRELVITGTAPEGKVVTGWKLSGGKNEEIAGSELTLNMTSSALTIEPILGDASGINDISANPAKSEAIYDLMGNKVETPMSGRIYIRSGKKLIWK